MTMPRFGPAPGARRGRQHRFRSLRRRPSLRTERYALGKSLARQGAAVIARVLGGPPRPTGPGRADPAVAPGSTRLADPDPGGRMVGSPYGFLRGSAIVMAEDVAGLPATGITPVICGDAHLGNFGFYASPEGELVIDLNDFDEAHPGRLGVGPAPPGRPASGSPAGERPSEQHCADAVSSCVAAYRAEVRYLADQPLLMRSYNRLDVDHLHETATEKSLRAEIAPGRQAGPQPHQRPRAAAVHPRAPGPPADRGGAAADHPRRRRRTRDADRGGAGRLPGHPGAALAAGRRRLHASSTSPTRSSASAASGCAPTSCCWRAAAPTTWCSCSSSRPAGRCWPRTCTASRPGTPTRVSGWSSTSRRCRRSATRCWAGPRVGGREYYVRQFRNMKGTIPLDAIDAAALADYAGIVGHLLAKGHARTSGASMIAGYCRQGCDKLDAAMCRFARAYADQTEADHAALVKAVKIGTVPATEGALDRIGSAFRIARCYCDEDFRLTISPEFTQLDIENASSTRTTSSS